MSRTMNKLEMLVGELEEILSLMHLPCLSVAFTTVAHQLVTWKSIVPHGLQPLGSSAPRERGFICRWFGSLVSNTETKAATKDPPVRIFIFSCCRTLRCQPFSERKEKYRHRFRNGISKPMVCIEIVSSTVLNTRTPLSLATGLALFTDANRTVTCPFLRVRKSYGRDSLLRHRSPALLQTRGATTAVWGGNNSARNVVVICIWISAENTVRCRFSRKTLPCYY